MHGGGGGDLPHIGMTEHRDPWEVGCTVSLYKAILIVSDKLNKTQL